MRSYKLRFDFSFAHVKGEHEPTFCNETASTIATSWVELNEFQVLEWQTSLNNHSITIARAHVGTCAAEVSPPVSTSSQNNLVGSEAMKGAVLHVERNHIDTLAVLHDQVKTKVFNEEVGIMAEGLAVKRVE